MCIKTLQAIKPSAACVTVDENLQESRAEQLVYMAPLAGHDSPRDGLEPGESNDSHGLRHQQGATSLGHSGTKLCARIGA